MKRFGALFCCYAFCCAAYLDRAIALDFNKDCSEIISALVTAKDELRVGESTAAARTRVLLLTDQAALKQTIGASVSAGSSYSLQSNNKKLDERSYHRIKSQAAGFVKQQIENERTESANGREFLVISSKASVCVPKSPLMVRETVMLRSAVNVQKMELPEFRMIFNDVFSNSSAFTIVENSEEDADIDVFAGVDRIEWVDVDKNIPPNFLGDVKNSYGPSEFQRLNVGVTLTGKRDDGSVITVAASQYRNFPPNADPTVVAASYVREVLRQASRQLHDKLARSRVEAASPTFHPQSLVSPKSKEW